MAASNFYGIVGVGRSSLDANPASINDYALGNGLTTSSTTTESKSFGWKIQLGMQISNLLAVEGGYMDLGTAKFTNTNNRFTATGNRKADLFNLDLVGKFPINPSMSLLARFGGYRWETNSDVPNSVGLANKVDNGFDFKFGAGLQYDFTKQFALRGAYDRFNGVGSSTTTGDSKVNLFSVDAVLKF